MKWDAVRAFFVSGAGDRMASIFSIRPVRTSDMNARPERFELPTTWFEAKYSIQLSYGRMPSSLAESSSDRSAESAPAGSAMSSEIRCVRNRRSGSSFAPLSAVR